MKGLALKSIKLLDCTLRDGGYCNQWKFGKKNINFIVNELLKSGVNIKALSNTLAISLL